MIDKPQPSNSQKVSLAFMGRKRLEWALLTLGLGLVAGLLAYIHFSEVDRVYAVEHDRLQTLSKVLASQITQDLVATNRSLARVISDNLEARSPQGTPFNMSRRLRALHDAANGMRAITMLNAKGVVVASSLPELMGINLGESADFKAMRDHPDKDRLQVSEPFHPVNKEQDLIMTLSRMVPGPKGEFAGLLAAALPPEYFTANFEPAIYSPDMWAEVVHGAGIQFGDFPQRPGSDGFDLNVPSSLFGRHLATGLPASVQTGVALSTGERRVMALQTIQPAALNMDHAMVIGISRDLVVIAQPLRTQAITYAVFYSLLLLICGSLLYWIQRRHAQAQALLFDRAAERLQADERLQVALRGANLSLWSMDIGTRCMTYDDNCFAVVGLTPQDYRDDHQCFLSRIWPEDLQRYQAAREACISGNTPFFEVATRVQHKNGHWLWTMVRGQVVVRDLRGQALTLMGTFLDFTALKTAEQALRESRNELEAIFDSLTEAVFVFDKHQKILRINRAGRTLHGLFDVDTPVAEMMSSVDMVQSNGEVVAPDQWPSRRGARGDFVHNFELEIRCKDMSARAYTECTSTARSDDSGQVAMVIVTSRNITERKLHENLLHESEANLRQSYAELEQRVIERTSDLALTGERLQEVSATVLSIVGTMADGVLTIDELGTIETMNPAAECMFGYAVDEIIGQNIKVLMPELDQSADGGYMERYRISGSTGIAGPGNGQEVVGRCKDGRTLPLDLAFNVIAVNNKRKFVGILRDITEFKLATSARAHALQAAESANLAKTDFLANMSHEIRSPLNAILGLAYLLEQSQLNQDAQSMVRKIRASGRMLLSLINDILDMSKIEAGQMLIEQAPFSLSDVMENIAVSLGVAVGEKDIELVISPVPAGVANILGDALRLEQVLINLISNAAKFTQAGSIQVRTEVLHSNQATRLLRFSVKDTGIGIAPELQAGVFSAFAQADTSTSRRYGGTGLGLTICRQLVRLMGGEIGVVSSQNEGSEFWFTVPLLSADPFNCSSPNLVALSVLIADDSEITLQAIADTAIGLGWQVNAVDSGAAALALVLERKHGRLPDVVVLDWKMPGMDGLITAQLIREGVARHECPIVIMATGHSLASLSAQPGAELVDAILYKPITASGLYNAVMEAQRRRLATAGSLPVFSQQTNDALAGVRVLVVDDSEINRDVAQSILAGQGAIVLLAEDGQGAIDWLLAHEGAVDVVLMDVQMPLLDGIEATRRLRSMPQFSALPIVALTAGAFKSQQDAALAAGMNHFVSKPFDIPSTIALIQRLCGLSRPAHRPAAAPSTPADLQPKGSTMDVAQGLKLWASKEKYQSYLRRFVRDYGTASVVIQTSLAQGDPGGAAALAHKLSGVAGSLALGHIHHAAQELERILEGQDSPALALAQLDDSISTTLAEINQYAPPAGEATVPSGSVEVAPQVLSTAQQQALKPQLIGLLEALDSDNATTVKNYLKTLTPHIPPAALAAIFDSVLGYDFRGAEAQVQQLAIHNDIYLGG